MLYTKVVEIIRLFAYLPCSGCCYGFKPQEYMFVAFKMKHISRPFE